MNKPAIAAHCALAVWSAGAVRPARAQFFDQMPGSAAQPANIEGFTVAGKGFVAAKPDLVEIDLEVIASSELTADAIVKYRDAKRRIRDAFAALKLGNVARRRTRPAGRSEGADAKPLFLRLSSPTRAPRPRSSSRGSWSSRRPTSARWTRKACCSSSAGCSTSPRTPAPRSGRRTT